MTLALLLQRTRRFAALMAGCFAGAAVIVMLLTAVWAQEQAVALNKAPKPVMDAVRARFPEAAVSAAAKETDEGKVTYEVTIKWRGQNIDVTVTPEGGIALIEREIATQDLPESVVKTLQARYPRATSKIVEEITTVRGNAERLAYYELLLVLANKKVLEVQVAADGKILNEERKTGRPEDRL